MRQHADPFADDFLRPSRAHDKNKSCNKCFQSRRHSVTIHGPQWGMKCDLHVHTHHSGMCTVPVMNRICRESYNDSLEVYETLKRRGMDLVTVTDHDSIDAVEPLRRYPDFFLSEEVSCTTE